MNPVDIAGYNKLNNKTGVYLFWSKNTIIYVGKAKYLKIRVRSHFTNQDKYVGLIDKITSHIVDSELEALLLEAKLIKAYKPKFNFALKDGKRYLYIGISKEIYPRLYTLRQPEKENQIKLFFGPYTSSSTVYSLLKNIRHIYPYRSCRVLPQRPCLYYSLKLCSGMCVFEDLEYGKRLKKIISILEGDLNNLILNLTGYMQQLANKYQFEEANIIKSEIASIVALKQKQWSSSLPAGSEKAKQLKKFLIYNQNSDPYLLNRIETYDIANQAGRIISGSMVVFIKGEPEKSEYRQFKITLTKPNDPLSIYQVIYRRLKHHEWLMPQLIIVDGGKTQIAAAYKALIENNLDDQISLIGIAKRQNLIYYPKVFNRRIVDWKIEPVNINLGAHQLILHTRDEAHRFSRRYYHKLESKRLIPFWPKRRLKVPNEKRPTRTG